MTALVSSLAAPLLGESLEWKGLMYFSIWPAIPVGLRPYVKKLGIDGCSRLPES